MYVLTLEPEELEDFDFKVHSLYSEYFCPIDRLKSRKRK